ncbi:PepSY-associated TM helix domain-containing protein [Salinibius halmophilus]|uniref:PepSY-associated TM helix domain-containing protein n=1 Tax=Salinibius halmophilus TaxID=1853216 RepID=UPI000E664FAB|nr:PepSY domain-containing protein [Salinibius halmophilus]
MISNSLKLWLWRWHVIAGLFVLPFIILLATTGAIYLFKDQYRANIEAPMLATTEGEPLPLSQQFDMANMFSQNPLTHIEVADGQATHFYNGRFSPNESVYVDPATGGITGQYIRSNDIMETIRNLHGELLMGDYGTKVIELVASWLVVLIITGIVVFWPRKQPILNLVRVRLNKGKRIMMRDLHAVLGFWISAFLLVIIAGGLPWTDLFGANFHKLKEATNSGYPATWFSSRSLNSTVAGEALTLDEMFAIAQAQELPGKVYLALPQTSDSVFTVSNSAKLSEQQVMHFDQYSGELLLHHTWDEVGMLSAGQQVVMRLHQGEFFGIANWLIALFTCIALVALSLAGITSYLMRKPKGKLGLPKPPASFRVGLGTLVLIAALGLILPAFGISVLIIVVVSWLSSLRKPSVRAA